VTCASGQAYTVQAGDTCQSIGLAHSVSQGTLRILNGIPPASCSSLVTGQTLCLPKTCQTYVWQTNDTCASIAYAHGISTTTLIAYNPAINPACSNTDLTNGTVICLSPAFGTYTPTTIAGVTPTGSATYANSTASAPGAVASGTTLECGKWYKANSGDTCSVISVAYNIAVSLFKLINPSIDSGCDNITPGLYYCVQPVAGWNTTASNTTTAAVVTPPGPTPTGTTSQCYEWYVVQPNDTCSIIEASFGITFAQIVQWNPSIDSNCYNLMLNESYCVSGPSNTTSVTATTTLAGSTVASTVSSTTTTVSSPSTSSSTGSATVSPPAPTPSGTTSQCYEWYVVHSADSCNKIETTYSISFAQLQAWNPSLDSACSNLIAGEAYCVAGATTATTATTTATASPTAGACLQTYTVVGGDTCYTIDQQFGITQAQLTSWNSLDANCDIYAGQVLCVKE
jgi:LysM repeat protein